MLDTNTGALQPSVIGVIVLLTRQLKVSAPKRKIVIRQTSDESIHYEKATIANKESRSHFFSRNDGYGNASSFFS